VVYTVVAPSGAEQRIAHVARDVDRGSDEARIRLSLDTREARYAAPLPAARRRPHRRSDSRPRAPCRHRPSFVAAADTDDDPLRPEAAAAKDQLAGAARRGHARIALIVTQQRQPARRCHFENCGGAVAENAPRRIDLASEWIVHSRVPHIAAGRAHEGKRRPLSPSRAAARRSRHVATRVARHARPRSHSDRIGTAFERLGSDDDRARRARHAGR